VQVAWVTVVGGGVGVLSAAACTSVMGCRYSCAATRAAAAVLLPWHLDGAKCNMQTCTCTTRGSRSSRGALLQLLQAVARGVTCEERVGAVQQAGIVLL
jgi:hypothetical protein